MQRHSIGGNHAITTNGQIIEFIMMDSYWSPMVVTLLRYQMTNRPSLYILCLGLVAYSIRLDFLYVWFIHRSDSILKEFAIKQILFYLIVFS